VLFPGFCLLQSIHFLMVSPVGAPRLLLEQEAQRLGSLPLRHVRLQAGPGWFHAHPPLRMGNIAGRQPD